MGFDIIMREAVDDLFAAEADIYVCPVNLAGQMGAGLGKLFKQHYPKACQVWQNCVATQHPSIYMAPLISIDPEQAGKPMREQGPFVCFLAVHESPMHAAELSHIKYGILHLLTTIQENEMTPRIAVPALGCGMGRLDWQTQVMPLVRGLFMDTLLTGTVELYPPR